MKIDLKKFIKYGLLIFGVILIIGYALKGEIFHEEFQSERWKSWTETETEMSLRWDMMNSLQKNLELKGKSKFEIIELLGKPENKTNSSFRYYLGMAKRGINTGSLIINFDERDILTDFDVWNG